MKEETPFVLLRNYKYLLDCEQQRSNERLCVNYVDYLPDYLRLMMGVKIPIIVENDKKNINKRKRRILEYIKEIFNKRPKSSSIKVPDINDDFNINDISIPLLGDRLLRIGMPFKNSFWMSIYTLLMRRFMGLSNDEKLNIIKSNQRYNNCDIISIKDANNVIMDYMELSENIIGFNLNFIIFNYYPTKHYFNIETFGIPNYIQNIISAYDNATTRILFLIRFINDNYETYYEPIIIVDRAYYNNVDSMYDVPMFKSMFNPSITNVEDDIMRGHLKNFLEKYERERKSNS